MLKNDIKHTYYGRPITMAFRGGSEYPNSEQMRRSQENRDLKQRVLKGKTSVYRNYSIPAAPAFRVLSRHDVEGITERLRRSTVANDGPEESADDRQMDGVRRGGPKFLGLRRFKADIEQDDVTQRLCTMTHMARLRAERDPYRQAVIINAVIPSDSIYVRQYNQGRRTKLAA